MVPVCDDLRTLQMEYNFPWCRIWVRLWGVGQGVEIIPSNCEDFCRHHSFVDVNSRMLSTVVVD